MKTDDILFFKYKMGEINPELCKKIFTNVPGFSTDVRI